MIVEMLIAFGAGVFALGSASWLYTRGRCPRCGARALRWTYERKDRGPDQRYSHNPRYCASCGWSAEEPDDDDGLGALTAASTGSPVAVPLDVDRPEVDPALKRVEAALARMRQQSSVSERRRIAKSARKGTDAPRAMNELTRGAAEVELDFARAALEEGAELQAELEILRERLEKLEVPQEEISRTLKELARNSQ